MTKLTNRINISNISNNIRNMCKTNNTSFICNTFLYII